MKTTPDKIIPHLWFDTEAIEAVTFYTSIFPNSEKTDISTIHDTPSGDADILSFKLWNQEFMAINAGPIFKFSQAVSFYVYCGSQEMIENLYSRLLEGGQTLMPLQKYPWSENYAWIQDKYGVGWQLDVSDCPSDQKILPSLLFANEKMLKVKEAVELYTSIFPNAKSIFEAPYGPEANLPEGSLLFAQINLGNYNINMMSSTLHHDFDFNEAISLIINCDNQEEVDYYWNKFTDEGQEQPCGWVKDKFGVSWQITPKAMGELMQKANLEQKNRVIQAMLKMKKFDIQKLQDAYDGK